MTKRICAIVIKSSAAVPGEISAKLETAIRMGCSGFLSGLEYGAGLTAAETILQRKVDRPCLTLECSWQRKLYAECCHRVYYPLDPGSIRQGHWVSGARCS